jgi:hypothetical protein
LSITTILPRLKIRDEDLVHVGQKGGAVSSAHRATSGAVRRRPSANSVLPPNRNLHRFLFCGQTDTESQG